MHTQCNRDANARLLPCEAAVDEGGRQRRVRKQLQQLHLERIVGSYAAREAASEAYSHSGK